MDGVSAAGLPDITPATAVLNESPAPTPILLAPLSTSSSTTLGVSSLLSNGVVIIGGATLTAKTAPPKRIRKPSDKPRPPRKKPVHPPAPRPSRAKPKAKTPPAASPAAPTLSLYQNDQTQQANFLNNLTSYTVLQGGGGGGGGGGIQNQIPIQPYHQQQFQSTPPQPQQRGTRVLLPKPASGAPAVPPPRPLAPHQTHLPTNNTTATTNSGHFQNGLPANLLPGQAQFMSFQNTTGQMQQIQTATGPPDQNNSLQMNSVSGGQQQGGQLPQGQLTHIGGGGTRSGVVNQLAGAGGTATQPPMLQHPGGMLLGGQNSMQQAGQPGTVQVRLQVIQTSSGPMTLAFFPDQGSGSTFNNSQLGMQFQSAAQQNQMNQNQGNGFIPNGPPQPNYSLGGALQQPRQMPGNFISVNALAAQAGQQQPPNTFLPAAETKKEDPVEPEFNLEDFLMPGMFTTSAPSGLDSSGLADVLLTSSIMDELVAGPMFQSPVNSSFVNGPPSQNALLSSSGPETPAKKKRVRKKKDTPTMKQVQIVEFKTVSENRNLKKVEEILKSYAEENSRSVVVVDALPSAPFLLSTPIPSSSCPTVLPSPVLPVPTIPVGVTAAKPARPRPSRAKKSLPVSVVPVPGLKVPVKPQSPPSPPPVVVVQRPPTPPVPPLPPPKPSRPKTDLAVRHEKDEKFFEKLMMKPFKGVNSAVNRLLPFHLLSTPDETTELLERESRAFHHVAHSLVDREAAIYRRFSEHIVGDAAEPISKLDILACSSTWLDMEREEFEAEKLATAEGIYRKPPVWVYTDLKLEPDIPYHDGNSLLGFTEEPVEDVPSPPVPREDEKPPPAAPPIGIRIVSTSEAGIKMRIKRSLPPSTVPPAATATATATATTPEPPAKKISLKFKMSGKKGWEVGRPVAAVPPGGAAVPPGGATAAADAVPPEDVVTRSAVDSILHVVGKVGGASSSSSTAKTDAPVMRMLSNGLSEAGGGHHQQLDCFYGSSGHFAEPDTDTALDEAINSILG